MAEERYSLKDALFNAEKVAYLGQQFGAADARFDAAGFERDVMAEMLPLELKARMDLIARVLAQYLPDDFHAAADVIEAALPEPLDPTKTDDDFGDFIFGPLGTFVQNQGIAHFTRSMALLKEITKRFSMEYAIRPFLNAYPDQTRAELAEWAFDENYHVRRLVSEGTRPKLPWGMKIGLDVRDAIPFLDTLHSDKTRYVTRSVANHLNDIAKTDPALVIETLRRWRVQGEQGAKELDWITRHALRTLIKQGHPDAMELLGYGPDPAIEVGAVVLGAKHVAIGDVLAFDVEIVARDAAKLLVDYAVEFVKADGSRKPKVFKLKQVALKAGERVVLKKRHRFKGDATTFRLYPGTTRIVLQINGVARSEATFDLIE
ncbi:DNA alkylation repair protein [Amylibacter sp. IMCC11727]|uniref:DNA alkylation repair protein n=1 Tax=Amylibacter sp. IMCC11727 TaxID=3039851 RepID=UPI00244E3BFB|nr:DNA alkylation repair protein [Amylibacter sp. IMCC11727]WGI23418.1 DNA alkylation repair protein [Amylibacter sp. IMCC11727]